MKGILRKKQGQLKIGDAPGVVLIVLFLFMVLATSAFVLNKYQDAFGADESKTVNNESVTQAELSASTPIDNHGACNFRNFAVTHILNASNDLVIDSGNYTVGSNYITNTTGEFVDGAWKATYTFNYAGVSCNITTELTEEVEDNVSIAGMVLTISLIGIVLSILIGLFYVFTARRGL